MIPRIKKYFRKEESQKMRQVIMYKDEDDAVAEERI
jgi:hypothetical protein